MHTETTPIAIITVKEPSAEFRRKISGITLNSTLTGLVSMKRQFIETYFDKKSFESKQLLDEIRKLEVLSSANSFHIASGKSWDYLLKILGKASSCAKINDFCKKLVDSSDEAVNGLIFLVDSKAKRIRLQMCDEKTFIIVPKDLYESKNRDEEKILLRHSFYMDKNLIRIYIQTFSFFLLL